MIFLLNDKQQQQQMRIWGMLLVGILSLAVCEEWYQPDSHMISDVQFQDLVIGNKNTFKIVKYFSPHCQYCRYLKQVVDKLKHEKTWCFSMFDFNCAWYPQHCMQYVRSASFPYTAIHNAEGELLEEIHGFYPEQVIRTIFDRIQEQCLGAKRARTSSLSQETEPAPVLVQQTAPPVENKQPEAHQQVNPENNQQATARQQAKKQAEEQRRAPPKQEPLENPVEAKLDEAKIPLQQEQIKIQKQQIRPPQMNPTQNSSMDAYIKYIIYGITVLIAGFYFHKINKGKEIEDHHHSHSQKNQTSQQNSPLLPNPVPKVSPVQSVQMQQQILEAQSQLISTIADQQL